MLSIARTMIGVSMFEKMCFAMIRVCLIPPTIGAGT